MKHTEKTFLVALKEIIEEDAIDDKTQCYLDIHPGNRIIYLRKDGEELEMFEIKVRKI